MIFRGCAAIKPLSLSSTFGELLFFSLGCLRFLSGAKESTAGTMIRVTANATTMANAVEIPNCRITSKLEIDRDKKPTLVVTEVINIGTPSSFMAPVTAPAGGIPR